MLDVINSNRIASETVFSTPDVMVLSEYYIEEDILKEILFIIAASGMESVKSYLYYNNRLPVEVIDILYMQAYAKCYMR